ncbi:MAG: hypothetical protein AAGA80_18465 [Cyanobacteria bacterium P01_F01_bin.143]
MLEVSLIIEPEVVSEEDAPLTTTFTFSVEGGEIPEGGLPILFGGEGSDLIDILSQLDGNFTQELIGMESLGFFPAQGVVGLNLLENEAVLTRTIANDIIEEVDRTFVFNVVPNDEGLVDSEYIVSAENGSDSLTLTDDNGGPGVGPTVSFSLSTSELTEGDEFTVNFSVDGDIPEGGLPVLVNGDSRGVLGEFDLFNNDGTPAFTTTGIAGIPEIGDSRASSFIAVLTEADASITLSAFRDLIAEDSEEFSFTLANGEEYEVDSDGAEAVLTISDQITNEAVIDEAVFNFDWTGQIAEFSIEGQFSFDQNQSYVDGIVREENLLSFDISFFDPEGNLMRTYEDNHLTFPEFNFAYDTTTQQILNDGIFTEPDGLNVGEKTSVGEDSFTGLNLWSKSKETSSSLIHFDDWSGEFGYPLGYSSHEDIAFVTLTTQELIDIGKVGETYLDQIQDSLDELGQRINVTPVEEVFFNFDWTGQIADFSVEGQFSFDENQTYVDGIVREEDLLSFDISFFDPEGNLMRTYEDNHLTFPEFNFAYDTTTQQILNDGIFTEPDGLNVGEKTPVGEDSFTGLNLWSKSKETSSSLIHLDDWSDEFEYPLGYSTHEDIGFITQTVAELIEIGKVGETYIDQIQDSLDELGQRINVTSVEEVVFDFEWTGQIAEFSVEGQFSYDGNQTYTEGIVREEDLLSFDISFFDPDGNLLRTYEDNHLTFPEFNFAYDTNTGEILQDGYFLAEDGFNVGEKTAVGEDGFTGLNFWSRPEFNSQGQVPPPHLHIDDWSDEFGFSIGFSSHEDVAFLTRTTQQLLDTGRVGETYIDQIQDGLGELGQRIEVIPVE